MSFPLMSGYDHINVVADLDPVAAVRDEEIRDRIMSHPKLLPAGSPDFGHAVQIGTRWRIGRLGSCDPAGARGSLAAVLRRDAEHEEDGGVARAMLAAAGRLDPEEGEPLAKDEWELGPRRYRIIRVEKFTLLGDGKMEPPRATDLEPPPGTGPLEGCPVDPEAPAGQWEAQLRLNLVGLLPVPGTVPEQVRTEARHALRAHPGVVLLPPAFVVVEIKDGAWDPLTGGEGPLDARDHLAGYFAEILPRLNEFRGLPVTDSDLAAWTEAADHIRSAPGPEFTVLNRTFRTVRVSRLLRLGRDGPEPPRPSDQSRYGPT